MVGLARYRVEAAINGPVVFTPAPFVMRYNDEQTPVLDVWLSYATADGKKRAFDLTDWRVLFETITPGRAEGIFSSDVGGSIEITAPKDGRFLVRFPRECKDAIGKSLMAYFRVVQGDTIFSTDDFSYAITRDIRSVNGGALSTPPQNVNQSIDALYQRYEEMKQLYADALKRASDALERVDQKQNKVPAAVDGNYAVWADGSTADSGISAAAMCDMVEALENDLYDINERINHIESLGHHAETFDTYASAYKNINEYAISPTINDFITIRADETHDGAATWYTIDGIADNGDITFGYQFPYNTDVTGKAEQIALDAEVNRAKAAEDELNATLLNKADKGAYGLGTHGVSAYYNDIYGGGFYRYEPGGPNSLSGQFGGLDPNGEVLINANWDGNAGAQLAISPYNGIMGYRTMAGGPATWTPWKRVITEEEPLTIIQIPLNNSFGFHEESFLYASKDSLGKVTLRFIVAAPEGSPSPIFASGAGFYGIATLPAGFYPSDRFPSLYSVCYGAGAGNVPHYVFAGIAVENSALILCVQEPQHMFLGSISYSV